MRSLSLAAAMIAITGAAACDRATTAQASPPQAAPAQATADPQPSDTMKQTFADCTWGKVEGATLSIWSFACPQSGNARLVADDSLPGFVMEGTYEGVTSRRPVIIAFKKAADAPISAVLADVRARSPGPHSAECVLTQVDYEGAPEGVFGFEPVGAAKTAWDAFASGDGDAAPVDAPCGELGPQMSGDHTFKVLETDPTTVVYIDYGSEIQMFDADTLQSRTVG